MKDYKKIEEKWIDVVGDINRNGDGKKGKKYILVEFPYPSGSGLHIGHAFTFTGGDVYARFKRMQGYEVMFPMGWDAFGLPTENYAIKMKKKPQDVTKDNTNMYRKQMKRLAFSFDWDREVNTTDPMYYKWTQWIFIKLFEKGLAYKEEMPINWCPACKIGLANEEVVDGKCERCGVQVSRRNISQWVVKITDYADRLIDGLAKTDFIEKVKMAQINWIGKSEGAKVRFKIKDFGFKNQELEVFTTRPDTLYGATFMVVAPEHKLVSEILNSKSETLNKFKITNEQIQNIKEYVKNARKKSDLERTELQKDKTGVFSGLYAINPITNKEIPIWISDFVLASYGTGAIMAVPAHDERDFAFAKKFDLPITLVIKPDFVVTDTGEGKREDMISRITKRVEDREAPYTQAIGTIVNSGEWDGIRVPEEKEKLLKWIEEGGVGKRASSYHLRDWIFSRQHYWGEPIPLVKCDKCGWVPVKESDLPVVLPEVDAYEPTDTGESPLAKMTDWVRCKCPVCGKEAKRETDTMPNWAGSDWYYLAYVFASRLGANDIVGDIFSDSKKDLEKWMPVDVYIGGDEHNTLHLLYSRFVYQFLYDLGVLPTNIPEPYYKRMSHGVILGPDSQRMSKSRGNVIVPETVADKYGVDVVRCYLMFMGPFDATMAWNENTLMGVNRFLDKFSDFCNHIKIVSDSSKEVNVIVNQLIDGVGKDIEGFKYNTALAKMMEALNRLKNTNEGVGKKELESLIILLAPFAPYTAQEMWSCVGKMDLVHKQSWPEVDKGYLVKETLVIPVSVNGKKRAEISLSLDEAKDEKTVLDICRKNEILSKWLKDKQIVRSIYVPGKIVNFVVN